MMRRSNGTLHFFINGLDQGVAATNAPPTVWGVVDLYGMTVKVRKRREQKLGSAKTCPDITSLAALCSTRTLSL